MCGFKQWRHVFRWTIIWLVAFGPCSFVNAQQTYISAPPVPQNEAQMQAQKAQTQSSASQSQKPGLFQRLGAALRGDDPQPTKQVPMPPANVNNQGMNTGMNTGYNNPGYNNTGYNNGMPQNYQYPTTSAQQVTPPRPNAGYDAARANTAVATPTRVFDRSASGMTQNTGGGSGMSSGSSSLQDRIRSMQQKKIFDDIDSSSEFSLNGSLDKNAGLPSPPSSDSMSIGNKTPTVKTGSSVLDRSRKSIKENSPNEKSTQVQSGDNEEMTGSRSKKPTNSISTDDDSSLSGMEIDVPKSGTDRSTGKESSDIPASPRGSTRNTDDQNQKRDPVNEKTVKSTTKETKNTPKNDAKEDVLNAPGEKNGDLSSTRQLPSAPKSDVIKNSGDVPVATPKKSFIIKRQSPVLEVQTEGPNSVIVNKESEYRFKVTNNSDSAAESVVVSVELPHWAENTQAPEVSAGSTNIVPFNNEASIFQWQIGRINPKEQETLVLHLMLRERKPFDMKVTYDFKPTTSEASIDVLQPNIEMLLEGPDEVLWGNEETYQLWIKNTGNGDAQDVKLVLAASGSEPSTAEPFLLKVGEKKKMEVVVMAKQSGNLQINVQATGPYGLSAETTKQVAVRRAELQLGIEAPEMQFVDNVIEYVITARNVGTAPAKNVEISAAVPVGTKYLSCTGNGKTDEGQTQVIWTTETIPVGGEYSCSILCEAKREGECPIEATVNAESGIHQAASGTTHVEAIADVNLKIEKPQGPIPVGTDTEYQVIVSNRGTKTAENIDVNVIFDENLDPVSVELGSNKVRFEQRQREIMFERIPALAAGQTMAYKVKARALADGNHKIQAVVRCQSTGISQTSEEISRFYSARGKTSSPGYANQTISPSPLQASPMKPLSQANERGNEVLPTSGNPQFAVSSRTNQVQTNQTLQQTPGTVQPGVMQPGVMQAAQPQPVFAVQPQVQVPPVVQPPPQQMQSQMQSSPSNPMLNRIETQQPHSPTLLSGAMQSDSASARSMNNAQTESTGSPRIPGSASTPILQGQTPRPLSQRGSLDVMTLPAPPVLNVQAPAGQ